MHTLPAILSQTMSQSWRDGIGAKVHKLLGNLLLRGQKGKGKEAFPQTKIYQYTTALVPAQTMCEDIAKSYIKHTKAWVNDHTSNLTHQPTKTHPSFPFLVTSSKPTVNVAEWTTNL